jgi:hypothetical protein
MPPDATPHVINQFSFQDGVGTGEINEFENTMGPMVCVRDLHGVEASIIEPEQFSRSDIAKEFSFEGIDRHALRCHDVSLGQFSDAERFDSGRISERVQSPIKEHHHGIGSTQSLHTMHHRILKVLCPAVFLDQDAGNEFGIGGGGEDIPPSFKLLPKFFGIYQISIVSNRKIVIPVLEIEGLYIFRKIRSGSRVPDVSHSNPSLQRFQNVLVKDLCHQAFLFMFEDSYTIGCGDTCTFLPAMLKRVQGIVKGKRDTASIHDANDSTHE